MLIPFTHLSELSSSELASLKAAVKGRLLEGSHFVFQGKTFSMAELKAHKMQWESEEKQSRGQLLQE